MDPKSDATLGLPFLLSEKSWFGFDLDDTLHEFRRTSRAATTECLRRIAAEYQTTSVDELREEYQKVLKRGTSDAFVDGRSSHDYRRDRLVAVLDHFALDHRIIDELVDTYERTIVKNLELKQGAHSLLRRIKSMGRKVVIITEGPQDAQERAIQQLGLSDHVDFLATTNYFHVSKTSGLLGRVLSHLTIDPKDIVFIGDSMDRDIEPAQAEGIDAILYAEGQDASLASSPPTISSLEILEHLLSDSVA